MNKEKVLDLIKKYKIQIYGDKLRVYNKPSDDDANFIRQNRDEFFTVIEEQKRIEKLEIEERRRKIEEIEGLTEIELAKDDLNKWYEEFEDSFSDCGGLGVRKKPSYNFDEMSEKYPRAAAYLKAKEYADSANFMKSSIGEKAVEAIINNEDFQSVICQMEKEWSDYADEHMFD